MKKRAMLVTSLREIWESKARFLSIVGIIFLGVAFFVGIGATGPDMIQTADNYFKRYHLADTKIISTLGLTEEDVTLLEADPLVSEVQPLKSQAINLTEKNRVIQFIGYQPEEQNLNQYQIVEGRLPENSGEVALDDAATITNTPYKIGDTLTIDDKDDPDGALKQKNFTVVGIVHSPEFIDNANRGYTTIGKGVVDYFAVIPLDDLAIDTYTSILVSFNNMANFSAYTDEYDLQIDKNNQQLEVALANRPADRLAEIKATAEKELDKAKQEVSDGKKALADGKKQLDSAKKQLDEGREELASGRKELAVALENGQAELANQEALLVTSQGELTSKWQALEAGKEEYNAASGQIQQAQTGLAQLYNGLGELQTQEQQLTGVIAATEELASSIATVGQTPTEMLPEAIAQAFPYWQEVAASLPGGENLQGALAGLAATPNSEAFTILLASLSEIQANLAQQYQELLTGKTQVENQMTQVSQQIANYEALGQELAAGESQLVAAQNQIDNGWLLLDEGRKQLANGQAQGEAELAKAQSELELATKAYQDGLVEYEKEKAENEPKLVEAEAKIAEEEADLAQLKPATYYYNTQNDNPGYGEYKDNADRISSLATVFPIIFFLIAALVSLTTMTRMVEEKRMEIGTFKALGYKNHEIALKFMLYATTAGLLGLLGGLALGYYLFPTIIFNAYGVMYNVDGFINPWYPKYSLAALIVTLLCTVGTALLVLRIDLLATPASLLRPKAPKAGQRIFLERLTPIWNRLSFIQKVTMRNLFRYKQRMLMTVLGIAGCVGMIITGFGIRDSVLDIVDLQFNKLWKYETVVSFDEDVTPEEQATYLTHLEELTGYQSHLPEFTETYTYKPTKGSNQTVSLYVPQNPEDMNKFVLFNDRKTGEEYQMTDQGVIINEKLAKLGDLTVGDKLVLTSNQQEEYPVPIAAIVENYTGHFAYMTPTMYQEIFSQKPEYNSDLLLFDQNLSEEAENQIAADLMNLSGVLNVSFLSNSSASLDDTVQTLNLVVWILIISAGLLAFIVLYNLTNINVSERIRELSTIKVLGFYDNEVTMYVYRENMFLTILGIIAGIFFGIWEHGFVLGTVELDIIMFSPTIHWLSYVYSAAITLVFTIIVGFVMHIKLKHVDMIEALKSNE